MEKGEKRIGKTGTGSVVVFLNNGYGYGNGFLVARNIFRFMGSMSRFFTKKPLLYGGGFFSSRQTGERRVWMRRIRWLPCLGVGRTEGGSFQFYPQTLRCPCPNLRALGVGVRSGGSGAVHSVYTIYESFLLVLADFLGSHKI